MDGEVNWWLVGGGLALGILFGAVVQRSRFCMVAAVSNFVLMRDYRQVHAYLAAVAVAVLGSMILELGDWVAIADTSFRSSRFEWLALLLGGLIFGFGSMLAGGCAGRTVVRVGEGNLGALIAAIAFGIAAATTYFGILEPLRMWLVDQTSTELISGDASLAKVLGLPTWLVAVTFSSMGIMVIMFTGKNTRSNSLIVAGMAVGALVVTGWWITGYLSQDDFSVHKPGSLSFAAPLAKTMTFLTTGRSDGQGFALMLVAGTVLGAASSAISTRSFRWTLPDAGHLGHLLIGGTLMGIGAILAGGCNIGHGLSGLSTVSIKAMIAVSAIVLGMRLGIAWLQRTEKVIDNKSHQTLASGPSIGTTHPDG